MRQSKSKIRKRRKTKFRKINLKISGKLHAHLERYCEVYKLTPNRVIKKAIKTYLERFGPTLDLIPEKVSEKQLKLFAIADYESTTIAKVAEK